MEYQELKNISDILSMLTLEERIELSEIMLSNHDIKFAMVNYYEPETVDVHFIEEHTTNKLAVVKLVKEVTGLGLKEAKDFADGVFQGTGTTLMLEEVDIKEANEIQRKFAEIGCRVILKS